MGRLIFGMMQSLDGYIDGPEGNLQLGPPGPIVSRHLVDQFRNSEGSLCGRRMYEIMRYWDEDQPGWDEGDHEFAQVWRSKPKWVASRTLTTVGPNATLVPCDVCEFVVKLKSQFDGEIDVSGAELAGVLSAAGLVDEYRLYFRPCALGGGKPYFAGPLPALRLTKVEAIGEDVAQLIYAPA
jgi:dihydrofolate reductase